MWKQCIVLCALVVLAATPIARADAPTYGANLLVDGDAEENFGADDATQIVAPNGWRGTG
ncbi:MAG: hypothetical protein JO199_09040, partial [Candidatus Eremiobacteraeota bacterium]|nr:hypothetical protein [Candidatus Eremiobacteraeota bacterium]